ncbi:hypothetical protein H0O00_04555 [Candidatus Micrarchaeota archaeon]|nr:hypothetical protein [Candidatus Micrarchaeota archaeon]
MADAGFADVVSEARKLEKKLLEYAPYQDEIHIARTMDLEPRDYMDLTYHDMLNLYERNQKIISTAGMGILAARAEEEKPVQPVKTGDVESRLREMTADTLQKAEEVGKEPMVLEREAPAAPEEEHKESHNIEFEERAAPEAIEEKIEVEKPEVKAPEIEPEKEEAGEEKEEKEAAVGEKAAPAPAVQKPPERPMARTLAREEGPKVEVPLERKVIVATVPPALKESPDLAASRRYAQIKEQIASTLGEKADEATIKKKMLELTKQLFKEKITSRREEIKLQITALKNMLAGAKVVPGAKKKKEDSTNARIFQSLLASEQAELAHTKDSIIDSYKKQVEEVKRKFYDDIATTDDAVHRKKIFDSFSFSVTMLAEQLPDVIRKYKDFTAKKHIAEMEKLRDSLDEQEKETRKAAEERLDSVKKGYENEFASVRDMIVRDIDNLVEKTGTDILKKEEEKPAASEAKAQDLVAEINETDEGTMLYYLHTKDAEYYKRYERKQLAKAEALLRAKQLMAKDKGMSDTMVKKFFGKMGD